MKKVYTFIGALLICMSIYAQEKRESITKSTRFGSHGLSWKISKYWIDTLKKYNGGDNWTIKSAGEFLKRKESPYWRITKEAYQMDIPFGTGEGQQRLPGTLQRCDLSNNNLTGELVDNPIYRWEQNGFEYGIFSGLSVFYFSYNQLTRVTADFMHGYGQAQATPAMAFDHNQISEFNPAFHDQAGGGNSNGAIKIWLNNNKLSAYNDSWNGYWHGDMLWFLKSNAKFFRIENNLFNFQEMKKLYNKVEERLDYRWTLSGVKRDPEFKLTYAPQLPMGVESSNTLAAGDNIELSFSLPDSENKYIWELNGKEIPLSEGKDFSAEMSTARAGMYRCKVTNPALPELTIYSKAQMRFLQKDGNHAPSDFSINNNMAVANSPQWTVVGEFGGDDPDSDQVYFRLVDHEGDNADFRIIDGNTLVSSTILFEWTYKTEYKVRVQAYDIYGGIKEKEITISRGEVTGAVPTAMKLDNNSINENKIGSIGTFVLSGVETSEFSFSLPDAKDNRFFTIEGALLKTKMELNYEKQRYYTVRIKASKDDVSITKDFVVEALDVNDAPSGLILTTNTIEIGKQPGSLIGLLVATDDDPGDHEFEYSFTEANSNDFLIRNNNQLLSKREFIRSDIKTFPIKIKVRDKKKAEAEFSIDVKVIDSANPDEAAIVLSNYIADENKTGNVGKLSVNQGGEYQYELIAGENAEHNAWFQIDGKNLILTKEVDFETTRLLHTRVKAGDIETPIDVIIRNINERPVSIGLSKFIINNKLNQTVSELLLKDPDGDLGKFSLLETNDYSWFKIEQDKIVLIKENNKSLYTINVKASDGEFELEQELQLHSGNEVIARELQDIGVDNFLIKADWTAGTKVCNIIVEGGEDVSLALSGADAGLFQIEDGILKTNTDDLNKSVYSVDISASSGSNELTKTFNLYVPIVIDGTDYINADDVKVYPNPVHNVLYVKCEQTGGSLAIYDLMGIKLKQVEISDKLQDLPVNELNPGVYVLQYIQGNKLIKRQFIKN